MQLLPQAHSMRWSASGLATFAILFSGCQAMINITAEDRQHLELMASDIRAVAVFTDNGYVHVRPSTTSDTILVTATIVAQGHSDDEIQACFDAVEIQTPCTGPDGKVQEIRWGWKGKKPGRWGSTTVSFDIEMPAGLELACTTDNGEIDAEGITGSRTFKSDNGRIRTSDWEPTNEPVWDGELPASAAKIVAESDNGEIEVKSAAGALVLGTDNGPILARSAARQVRLTTSNGSINARLVTAGRLDGRIETDNGSVELVLNPDVSTRLDCKSDHGGIARLGFMVNESFSPSSENSLKASIGQGEGLLEIKTDNGGIRLEQLPRKPTPFMESD